MRALCDTNIVIDLLSGLPQASRELEKYEEIFLSRITWMEVLVGAPDHATDELWRRWLGNFNIVELDEPIATEAVGLRRTHRIKLPDAIVWASARSRDLLLLTHNSKDYPKSEPGIRIPYKLS